MDEMTMRVREVERKFLRYAWWAFPAAGLIVAMLTGGGFWAWVDGEMPWLDWRQALTMRGAVLACAALVAVGVWRVLLRRTFPGWFVALVVATGFAVAECAVRIPAAQTAFWLAAGGRGYWPEAGTIRLEEAAGRGEDMPGIILAGSSQMRFGVDDELLRKLIPSVPVVRRVIGGMWSQSMLAMWGRFSFRPGDLCVQIRSPFDFLGKSEFDADWFRPVASMEGAGMVLRTAGWRIGFRNGGKVVDYLLATSLEGWRMRDGMRKIVVRFLGKEGGSGGGSGIHKGRRPSWGEATWSEWQWRAFVEGARKMRASGIGFLVLEGDINPSLHDAGWNEKREEWLARMKAGEREGLWRFVGLEEQDERLLPGDWSDGTHLNPTGQEKLTRAIGRVLDGR